MHCEGRNFQISGLECWFECLLGRQGDSVLAALPTSSCRRWLLETTSGWWAAMSCWVGGRWRPRPPWSGLRATCGPPRCTCPLAPSLSTSLCTSCPGGAHVCRSSGRMASEGRFGLTVCVLYLSVKWCFGGLHCSSIELSGQSLSPFLSAVGICQGCQPASVSPCSPQHAGRQPVTGCPAVLLVRSPLLPSRAPAHTSCTPRGSTTLAGWCPAAGRPRGRAPPTAPLSCRPASPWPSPPSGTTPWRPMRPGPSRCMRPR